MKDILLEIGTEELPATNLAEIFDAGSENILEVAVRKAFESSRVVFGEARVWATPRRLVFYLKGVAEAQSLQDQRIRIISKAEAFSESGQPTEKLLVILKHRNATLQEIEISVHGGKETVFIKKADPVRKTLSILPGILQDLVKSLPFPKTMKWDDSGLYFPRPVRHALCFYGDKSLSFKIGNVRTKNETIIFTKGRRKQWAVKDIPSYFQLFKKNGILLDPAARRVSIQEILIKLTNSLQGRWVEDAFLLNEVNFLVENPQGLSAPFDEEFLKLPLEVLTVSMARKQRLFGLVDKNKRVLPKFIAILDGPAKEREKKIISSHMENILHAKLQDSLFFYEEDKKIPLEKKRDELKNLVFLKNAGSMLEKSDRLVSLAKEIGPTLSLSGPTQKALERAAFLSKSDLLTQMVGEFPELQGIIGKYYALENKEDAEVAIAIGEQYLPRTVQDKLPESLAGSLLSVLDKSDLITSSFALGYEGSSSLDPFGLRRSATAILKILIDKKLSLSLNQLLSRTAQGFGKLEAFFKDRFKALLVDRGYREDFVEAVLSSRFEIPFETYGRIQALSPLVNDPAFLESRKIVERTMNILKGNKDALPEKVNASLFTEELEQKVFEQYENSQKAIRQAAAAGDFKHATSLYAEAFFAILSEFFEKVFVNAEDLDVRKNRLALLQSVNRLYTEPIADLSKIRLST